MQVAYYSSHITMIKYYNVMIYFYTVTTYRIGSRAAHTHKSGGRCCFSLTT